MYTFKYYKNGKEIKDEKTLKRIISLAIPPAYTNVKISENANYKLQAVGYDNKGRKQYIYHPKFIQNKQSEKYENIAKLGKYIDNIDKTMWKIINANYQKRIQDWDYPNVNIALIIYLISRCNFSIGNMKYLKLYNSHGALTLKKKHIISVKSTNELNEIKIEFIGKKGVVNTSIISAGKSVTNNESKIIKMFSKIKNSGSIGQNDFIFKNSTNDGVMNINQINIFLQSFDPDITPKMFRTWYANYYFLEKVCIDYSSDHELLYEIIGNYNCRKNSEIKKTDKLKIEKRIDNKKKKYIKECCEYIASKLHNTASISKKSYIDAELIDFFCNNPLKFFQIISHSKCNKELTHKQKNNLLVKTMEKLKS